MMNNKAVFILPALLGWLGLTAMVAACSTPVFRYALERWPAENYNVIVYHRGALAAADQALVQALRAQAQDPRQPANLTVETFDVAATEPGERRWAIKPPPDWELPRLAVYYPNSTEPAKMIWSAPLNAAACKRVIASPQRQAMAQRLLAGDAIVWVLVAGGHREEDEAAAGRLAAAAPPNVARAPLPADPDNPVDPVPVVFSSLRISRDDPEEAVLLAMLLSSEQDLADFKGQPMVFPVFGRGRALNALVGKGIHSQNIEEVVTFLSGPCSCQIKEQNPGFDLLLAADWEGQIKERFVKDDPPPELTGVLPDPETNAPTARAARPSPAPMAPSPESPRFLRKALIALGVVTLAVLAGAWVIRRRGPP